VFLGHMDPPLSCGGRFDVERELSGIEVATAYVSPLRRARETAIYLRAAQRFILPELREIGFGEWTGKSWAEIELASPEIARQKTADWLGVTAPGAESWFDLLERLRPVSRRIRSGPAPAAVVAHYAVNAALASLIANYDPVAFTQRYGEPIEIDYDND
jgi:alpha-ribazole phosphatase